MKKQFFLYAGAVLAFFASCSKDEPDIPNYIVTDSEPISSVIISPKEAVDIANKSYNDFFEPKSRSTVHKTATAKNVSVFSSTSSRGTSDTTLYVVNFPDEGGYAIVAAPRNCESNLLAIVPEGSLDPAAEIENPGLKMFVDDAITYTSSITTGPGTGVVISPRLEEKIEYDTIINLHIKPRTALEWGQGAPLSKYCDNDLVGCAPLAIGMIMSYYETPKNLAVNFKNKTKQSVSKNIDISWSVIKNYKTNYSMYNNSEISDNTALILRQIGEYAKSDYDKDGTGTTTGNIKSALKHFLPNQTILNEIDFDPWDAVYAVQKGFVFMLAKNADTGTGHAWIAEGSFNRIIHEYHYSKRVTEFKWNFDGRVDREDKYLYYNWGWNGADNGYFKLWDMNPGDRTYTSAKYIAIE